MKGTGKSSWPSGAEVGRAGFLWGDGNGLFLHCGGYTTAHTFKSLKVTVPTEGQFHCFVIVLAVNLTLKQWLV